MSKIVMALIDADYDEFKPKTLRGFIVHLSTGSARKQNATFEMHDGVIYIPKSDHVEVGEHRFKTLSEAETFARENADDWGHLSSVDNYHADLRRPR